MSSPTILVTGATDGIGKATALELARRGARVIVHGRNRHKAETTREVIKRQAPRAELEFAYGDLAVMAEVRELAKQVKEVDVVLHNAGVFMNERTETIDGFETTFAINHLAPFLLTHLLLPGLKQRPAGRIVLVSSMAHESGRIALDDLQSKKTFDGYRVYAATKLANIMFAFELAHRLRGTPITANALHPGVISTKLLHAGFNIHGESVDEGAKTPVRVTLDPDLAKVSGRYFFDEQETAASKRAQDRDMQRKLYEASCKLVSVEPLPDPGA